MPRAGLIRFGKSVASIIEVGRLLVKAKADLEHGEWGRVEHSRLIAFLRALPVLSSDFPAACG